MGVGGRECGAGLTVGQLGLGLSASEKSEDWNPERWVHKKDEGAGWGGAAEGRKAGCSDQCGVWVCGCDPGTAFHDSAPYSVGHQAWGVQISQHRWWKCVLSLLSGVWTGASGLGPCCTT